MQHSVSAFGPFVLDRQRQALTRLGQVVPLGHRGYMLLETLLDAGGQPVSKQALMSRAWPGVTEIEEGNLTVQIAALRRQLGDDGNAMIVTVPRVGYRFIARDASGNDPPSADGALPVLAVLPFANLGAAAEDRYFADGVVEDITTALSRFKTFAVLSRSSSFALGATGEDARTAAADLGVRYALAGSIRRMGDRLRVTAQLVEASSGRQLWAHRYEGPTEGVFAFQDSIAECVVGIVEPTIRKAEVDRVRRTPAGSLAAYELYLKALPLVQSPGHAGHAEAMELLGRSMELDPAFALPRAYAAWILERRISMRQEPLGDKDRDDGIRLARSALALADGDALVKAISAWVLYRLADDASAVEAVRQAARDNPNSVLVLHLAAAAFGLHGAADEAYAHNLRAFELSPGSPEAYLFLQGLGAAELLRGNNEAAIQWCHRSLATFNDWLFTYITLVAAYSNLGRLDEAREMLRRVRELSPHLTMKIVEDNVAKEDAFADAVIPGLRNAGLPER